METTDPAATEQPRGPNLGQAANGLLRGRDLVFPRSDGEAATHEVALKGLAQLGWTQAQALRAGEITDPDAIPADLRGTFDRALANGCALLVYDEP